MLLAGVILAGGRSSRMDGRDKAFLELGARTLAERAHARLARQVGPIAISSNSDPAAFAPLGATVIADADDSRAGPLAGILAGLRWAASLEQRPAALVSVAVDTPFFPEDLAPRLAAAAGGNADAIMVATSASAMHPTFALWPLGVAGRLAAYVDGGGRRAGAFIRDGRHAEVAFAPMNGVDPFFNVNTPADFAAAEEILRRAP